MTGTILPKPISGISHLAERYDLFVIDQWGVMHDGHKLFPGTIGVFEELRRAGKTITILSNSGKRVDVSHRRLGEMGLPAELYDFVLTSGEQVYQGLKHRTGDFYGNLGERYFTFAWDEDRSIVEGLGYREVFDIDEADFILCSGTDRGSLAEYEADFSRALARGLPLTCANPDKVSKQPDGSLKMCPGALAEYYEQLGGTVQWHGKPQAGAYEAIRIATGCNGPGIGIGDSLAHDIVGAKDSGLDGLLVTSGIHSEDLCDDPGPGDILELAREYRTFPDFYIDEFRW